MAHRDRRRTFTPLSLFASSPVFTLLVLPLFIFLSFSVPASAAGSAVIGVDVGTEYIKAALVKPGIPLEIVPTKDSKRKELAAVAFKPTKENNAPYPERLYGGDALALAARYPSDVYANLKALLGIHFNGGQDETVKTYQSRYPALTLENAPGDRGTVGFRSNMLGAAERKDAFTVEELLAMQLKQIKANADELAGKGSDIKDVVITYPPFYTADEKRSLQLAAELAGLNVQEFVSDGLAVGLNYATSRTFPSVTQGQKPEYHIVYDMGAGCTTASVLRFQSRSIKDTGRFNKTIHEVQAAGSGWDRSLGGDSLNDLIVKDMIDQLVEHKSLKDRVAPTDVMAHGRTMARLWKDSEKVRQVLSANTETSTMFENLYEEDLNFRYSLTRSKFEKLAENHAARVGRPLEAALAAAGLQLADIDSIILHGGAVRTPFVQKQLQKFCGTPNKLRTSVNADESAVFGATFKGAALSPSFRVKDIRASDNSGYSVLLKWPSEGKDRQQKLFTPTSLIGQEKQVTVKNLDDFGFSFYQQIQLGSQMTESPIVDVKTQNLTASVTQLKDKFGCSPANITTKFSVRLSPVDGLPEVVGGSVSCEVENTEKKGSVVEDVKGFFGLGSKKEGQAPLGEDAESSESITLQPEESSSMEASASSTSAPSIPTKESKKVTPETKLEVIPIKFTTSQLGIPAPTAAELNRMKKRLAAFDASDRDRVLREESLNELEAFIYRSRDLVDDEDFVKYLKQGQLTILKQKVTDTSEWLHGDGSDAKAAEFQERLRSLKDLVNPALTRRQESTARPGRVEALQDSLKNAKAVMDIMQKQIKQDEEQYSSTLAESNSASPTSEAAASSTAEADASESPSSSAEPLEGLEEDPYLTSSSKTSTTTSSPKSTGPKYSIFQPSDFTIVINAYEPTMAWLETSLAQQEKLTESDDPALSVSEIDSRHRELERILKRMYQKMGAAATRYSDQSKKSGKKEGAEKSAVKAKENKKEKETGKPRKDEL